MESSLFLLCIFKRICFLYFFFVFFFLFVFIVVKKINTGSWNGWNGLIAKFIDWITGFARSGDVEVLPLLPTAFTRPTISCLQIAMAFSDEYGDILSGFVEDFKTAKNEKARKVVLRNAQAAVKESRNLREDVVEDLPKELETVCLVLYS
jgi:hypothetical protein